MPDIEHHIMVFSVCHEKTPFLFSTSHCIVTSISIEQLNTVNFGEKLFAFWT